uniref:Uncharacterized protein n=1 Tax=Sinocyclocheilus rhinocerous TaxID=307959 RepID=A0A673JXV6_9TELE
MCLKQLCVVVCIFATLQPPTVEVNGKYQRNKTLKSYYDHARGRTRINIGAAFQWWRELKEREGLESDAKVALFLLDR